MSDDHSELIAHLRAVHFALLGTCLGVFVATILSTPPEVTKAKADIEAIQRGLGRLTPDWLEVAARSAYDASSKIASSERHIPRQIAIGTDAIGGTPYLGNVAVSMLLTFSAKPLSVIQDVTGANSLTADTVSSVQGRRGSVRDLLANGGLIDLKAFETRWDFLAGSPLLQAVVPLEIDSKEIWVNGTHGLVSAPYHSEDPTKLSADTGPADLGLVQVDPDTKKNVLAYVFTPKPFLIGLIKVTAEEQVAVPALREFLTVTELDRRADGSNRIGTFKEAFPELAKLTADYQDLGISKIRTILAAEASRTEGELDIAGTKLPSWVVERWGLIVILTVQLYFAINLAQAAASLEGRAFDFPWLALYRGAVYRVAALFSVVGPPLIVVAGVLMSAVGRDGARLSTTLIIEAAAVTSASLAGGFLMRGVWRRQGASSSSLGADEPGTPLEGC